MNKLYIILILACIAVTSCSHNTENDDLTSSLINHKKELSYKLDSLKIVRFFKYHSSINVNTEILNQFYKKRNYQFAWITNDGLNEHVGNLINLITNDVGNIYDDSFIRIHKLNWLYIIFSNNTYQFKRTDSLAVEFELELTIHYFDYAKRNWGSMNDSCLKTVDWFITSKKINYEQLLDTILENNNKIKVFVEPIYKQYNLLKKHLIIYNRIEKQGQWLKLNFNNLELNIGDSSLVIPQIKKQLFLMGDLLQYDSTIFFNTNLEKALMKFQSRFGLKEDGTLNVETKSALSVSLHDRMQQLLINMERCKWVPIKLYGDYLVVNIPEFKLHVYHDDSVKWSCNVIVGDVKPIHNTVIFNDTLEYIVFRPYWNIPQNIIIKEILPAIKKNINYLTSHNLEVVNNSGKVISTIEWNQYATHFPYLIRQKPGKNNALGLVKFLFPNAYDIYLHDTPSKSLFNETTRAFSHGCIRIEEPTKLANYLLRNDNLFSKGKINNLMNNNKETYVKLKNKIPIFIAYFTAWVDEYGKLNFRDDVYHNDEKMKELLFNK